MNQELVKKIVLPFASEHYGNDWRLVQDNAPVHVSRFSKAAYEEMGIEVSNLKTCFDTVLLQCLDWPAQSPDLNPIEMTFGYLKEKLEKKYRPRNLNELTTSIVDFYREYCTPEQCTKWIRRMYSQMELCIKRNGKPVRGRDDDDSS